MMPVDVRLSDDEKYLIYKITEPFQMADLYEAYKIERHYRDEKPYILHSIVDMSGLNHIPPNWLTAKAGPGLTHPRSGQILFVGLSRPYRIIIDIIMRVMRYNRMQFFNTWEDAQAYMEELIASEQVQTDG